ncbi:MAG: alpha/beta hydrolase [Candidatus Shapirobacteria bacterium]
MKLAIICPGYLQSPDYLDLVNISNRLEKLGYKTERIDPCALWETGDVKNYNTTNYLKTIKDTIDSYKNENLEEVVLVGHSFGGFVVIIAGNRFKEVTKIVSLCPAFSFKSLSKWDENGIRHSERGLPNDPFKFRIFDVPVSFCEDRNKYSASTELKNLHKPLMVLAALEDDKVSLADIEKELKVANNPHLVKIPNMGHNFNKTLEESNPVADEIEKFLSL